MKIDVQSFLLLFLSSRRVLGEDSGSGGYGDADDSGYGGYGGYGGVLAVKDDCLVAETIASVPFASSGDTQETLGQGFEEAQTCSLVEDFTRGVWFQLAGDGLCYNATSLGSMFDTTIAVYTGDADCEGLLCLLQNDDGGSGGYGFNVTTDDGYGGYGSDVTSKVAWRTEIGETYYILLGGLANAAGPYQFSLNVSAKPLCAVCCARTHVCMIAHVESLVFSL